MSEHIDSAAGGSVYDFIEQIDEKHAAGHARLRETLLKVGVRMDETEDRLSKVERLQDAQKQVIDTLEKRKVEVTNLRFTPSMVISLLGLVAAIVGGQKWATSGLATTQSIELINAKMDAIKQHEDDYVKLQDERAARVTSEINRLSGQATMIDTKLSNLRETAIANNARR